MPKQSLITASIGIYRIEAEYFLQIISADNQLHYAAEMSVFEAKRLSKAENLSIEDFETHPLNITIVTL